MILASMQGNKQAVSSRSINSNAPIGGTPYFCPSFHLVFVFNIIHKHKAGLTSAIPPSGASFSLFFKSLGRTVVVAAIEGQLSGLFALVDTLRPEAREVVAELRRRKFDVWMVTGDNDRAALEVGKRTPGFEQHERVRGCAGV